jgi:hypothetical protein
MLLAQPLAKPLRCSLNLCASRYLRRIAPGAVLGYLLGIAALVLEAPPQL